MRAYTTKEVAALLKRTEQTVRKQVRDGKLPGIMSPSGRFTGLFSASEIDAILHPAEPLIIGGEVFFLPISREEMARLFSAITTHRSKN